MSNAIKFKEYGVGGVSRNWPAFHERWPIRDLGDISKLEIDRIVWGKITGVADQIKIVRFVFPGQGKVGNTGSLL